MKVTNHTINFSKEETPKLVLSCDHCVIFLDALFTEYLWTTASAVYVMFYSFKSVLLDNKIIPEKHDKKLATQSWSFHHQAYFIKAFVFADAIIKDSVWFQESISKRTFKNLYSLKKVRSLGMEKGIFLKNYRNRWERGTLMVCVIVMEKIVKGFQLFISI